MLQLTKRLTFIFTPSGEKYAKPRLSSLPAQSALPADFHRRPTKTVWSSWGDPEVLTSFLEVGGFANTNSECEIPKFTDRPASSGATWAFDLAGRRPRMQPKSHGGGLDFLI